ncbi:MAG TPA: hypothetical protein VF771_01940 [Longimicrobiaceae bacterium]
MEGTIQRYGLAPPTEEDALTMLARVMGVDGATRAWLRACRSAGVSRHGVPRLSADELLRVAEKLAEGEGTERVIGTSLAVRTRTWVLLSRNHAGGGR